MSKSPNRLVAVIFGAVYLLVGIFGFTVTTETGFFATRGGLLLGILEVNSFHSTAHLLIGAALLLAALSNVRAAHLIDTVVGAAFLLLGFVGLFIVNTDLNLLALNAPDNVVHFVSAVILLGVGLGAERKSK